MDSKLNQALFSGIVATSFMTLVMYLSSRLGLPEVHPPVMLSDMMRISMMLSWILHFTIGVVFAFFYMFVFKAFIGKIKSKLKKGLIFGFTLFVMAQAFITVLSVVFKNVSVSCDFGDEGMFLADRAAILLKDGCSIVKQGGISTMCMAIVFSFIGHLCYGVAVVYTIFQPKEQ